MIIGLTGAICSGKHEFAIYLENKYQFKAINLIKYFKAELKRRGIRIPKKSTPLKLAVYYEKPSKMGGAAFEGDIHEIISLKRIQSETSDSSDIQITES